MAELQTRKDNFATIRLVETTPTALQTGEIRLAVNRFSFTANNITYAVAGEMLKYWEFFPAADNANNDWGIIPVWGFATVTESLCDDINAGERLFGYFPPADEITLKPVNVSAGTLFDGAAHRAALPPGYNVYRRLSGEPNYDPSFDQERMLLFPLYVTAFCLHDMLKSNDWFNSQQVIIGSASSKTSIGLAYAIEEDSSSPKLVGLTSQRNLAAVTKLGIYDEVISYDQLTHIDASQASVIVDMSANGEMLGRLHTHLGDNMKFCSNVGMTHWEDSAPNGGVIAERSKMFFAPSHIQQRMQDWGPQEFEQKSSAFIRRTGLKSRSWLTMQEIDGLSGLSEVYDDVCHGRVSPELGLIIKV